MQILPGRLSVLEELVSESIAGQLMEACLNVCVH